MPRLLALANWARTSHLAAKQLAMRRRRRSIFVAETQVEDIERS